jgi:hypothetical protein
VESLAPVVQRWPEEADQRLMADLMEVLQRMVQAGYLPTSLLLVQLTDGRVRLDASIDGVPEAGDRLRRICNEYGPARIALWISVERAGTAVQLAIERLTGSPHRVAADQTWSALGSARGKPRKAQAFAAGEGSKRCSSDFPASSKNLAMREASLGITTGRLPKVDSSWRPSGARSSPVW